MQNAKLRLSQFCILHLSRNPRYVFFDLLYLLHHLRVRRLQRFRLLKEILRRSELSFVHHDIAHLQIRRGFILLIRQTFPDRLTDIALGLLEIAALHGDHSELQEVGPFHFLYR